MCSSHSKTVPRVIPGVFDFLLRISRSPVRSSSSWIGRYRPSDLYISEEREWLLAMVCAEDVVSYFRTLKSYERIWMMCKLQHCCMPFELRFLGTCLEELGRKDYNELRQAENEANSNAEANLSELRRIGDPRVRNKIILYLSLLHSRNFSCSNSLFKILCDCQEVNAFLKCEPSASPPAPPPPPLTNAAATASSSVTGSAAAAAPASNTAAATNESCGAIADEEEDCFEHLLMIYTLAVNHPAFSCEQKQTLQNIFEVIRAEQNKRSSLKRASMGPNLVDGSLTPVGDNPVFGGASVQMQVRIVVYRFGDTH